VSFRIVLRKQKERKESKGNSCFPDVVPVPSQLSTSPIVDSPLVSTSTPQSETSTLAAQGGVTLARLYSTRPVTDTTPSALTVGSPIGIPIGYNGPSSSVMSLDSRISPSTPQNLSPTSETIPLSPSPTPRFTNLRKLLTIIATQLEEEEMEGLESESVSESVSEFDSVSRTLLIIGIISPEKRSKVQQPVLKTEHLVPTSSHRLELGAPVPVCPVVLATTLGPLLPPSPPHVGPIPLPCYTFIEQFSTPTGLADRVGIPSIPLSHHRFIFEPDCVLAYAPCDVFNPSNPNDPSGQSIDYCVYLYPNPGDLDSRIHFVYGGSRIQPVRIEELSQVLPNESLIRSFGRETIQFLAAVIDNFRRGVDSSIKIRILKVLMSHPTWRGPNFLSNLVHQSPHVEGLLRIVSDYVNYPMGHVAQLFRQIRPEIDVFDDYRITCVCLDCEDFTYSDDEEDVRATAVGRDAERNTVLAQYFLMPHRFLPESSHSSGFRWNGTGIWRKSTGMKQSPQEWNRNPPEWLGKKLFIYL